MILDSSAAIAIILKEPGWEALLRRIGTSPAPAIGAPTLVEASIVLTARFGAAGRSMIDALIRDCGIAVVPFTEEHHAVAADAFQRFGKGRHTAALNFGDCLSYAVASVAGQPLLYVGADFARTDVKT